MEDDHHTNFLLDDWPYFCNSKSTAELTESLLMTRMELESTRIKAEQQLKLKNNELTHLKNLLKIAITEKEQAQTHYKTLFHQLFPTNVAPPYSAVSSISNEQEPITNHGFSSSDCEESIVSSQVPENPFPTDQYLGFSVKRLPENGRFYEAVIKAGPLLQDLMVAGAMPLWRHPPPEVDARRISPPPLVVAPLFDKKRGFCEGSESSTETKYRRISINSSSVCVGSGRETVMKIPVRSRISE